MGKHFDHIRATRVDTPAFCCRQGGEGVQQLAGDALTAQGGRNVSVIGVDGVRVNGALGDFAKGFAVFGLVSECIVGADNGHGSSSCQDFCWRNIHSRMGAMP